MTEVPLTTGQKKNSNFSISNNGIDSNGFYKTYAYEKEVESVEHVLCSCDVHVEYRDKYDFRWPRDLSPLDKREIPTFVSVISELILTDFGKKNMQMRRSYKRVSDLRVITSVDIPSIDNFIYYLGWFQ